MKRWWRKLLIGAAVELAVIAAVFIVYALLDGSSPQRARRVLTFALIVESMVAALAPAFGAERAARGPLPRALAAVLEPVGWVLAVFASGPLLLAVFFDRGALGAWLLAVLLSAAAGLASAGLVLALVRLTRKPLPSASLALALVLVFSLQPFYTLAAIKAAGPRTRRALINLGVRPPWMAASYALARLPAADEWKYVPVTSPGFYNLWVGTDYRVTVPGTGRYLLEYLIFAAALMGLAALRPGAPGGASPAKGGPSSDAGAGSPE